MDIPSWKRSHMPWTKALQYEDDDFPFFRSVGYVIVSWRVSMVWVSIHDINGCFLSIIYWVSNLLRNVGILKKQRLIGQFRDFAKVTLHDRISCQNYWIRTLYTVHSSTHIYTSYIYIHTVHASIGHVVYILLIIVILIQLAVPFDLIHISRESRLKWNKPQSLEVICREGCRPQFFFHKVGHLVLVVINGVMTARCKMAKFRNFGGVCPVSPHEKSLDPRKGPPLHATMLHHRWGC